jgi:peptidoglycan-associated lipoprotein
MLGRGARKEMNLRRLGLSLTYLLATLAIGACGGTGPRTSVPPTTTVPTLTSAVVHPAGETLGVSEEIVRLCKLELNARTTAPRYDFDRSDLQPGDRLTLTKVAECLTAGALKGRSLQLIGRADPRGESNYNMVLGAERAGGVADYLAHLGVARTRLDVTSRGELDAAGINEAGWQIDRRVDIVLSK